MICSSCKVVIKEYVFTDKVERDYCLECASSHPLLGMTVAYGFLAETIPFKVGDRVECRTAVEFVALFRPVSHRGTSKSLDTELVTRTFNFGC